jgi:hypothetical protein
LSKDTSSRRRLEREGREHRPASHLIGIGIVLVLGISSSKGREGFAAREVVASPSGFRPGFSMDGAADSGTAGAAAAAAKWRTDASRAFQYYLDRSTPHATGRWIGTLAVAAIYALRVYLVQGFYIVTYGLGIYLLNLLIGFLSPMVDPEAHAAASSDGPALPTRGSDEFKPFIRRLPEFKFWFVTPIPRSRFRSLLTFFFSSPSNSQIYLFILLLLLLLCFIHRG